MIVTTNINLKVPFNEKDQAKSLGARWNAEAKLWYVPQGVDTAPFEKWLSSSPSLSPNNLSNLVHATINVNTVDMSSDKAFSQANTAVNKPSDDDLDAINASLRDAYESPEATADF